MNPSREASPDRPARWTGAGLIPARAFGYLSLSIPLMLVQLDGVSLTVRARPAILGRFFGTKVLTTTPGDALEIFRVRNGSAFQGIEFRPSRRSSFYFYTGDRDAILNALTEAGFAVSSEPGRERPIWYQPDDD